MKIGGIVKCSMTDYPGLLAAVIFTQGCNMNCSYCHNKQLIGNSNPNLLPEEEVLSYLVKRRDMLDAVVISGGEPTLQPDLPSFIQRVKDLGYRVKLDTNGTMPEIIKRLLTCNLVDYIAMDIKAPLRNYQSITQTRVNLANIQRSIAVILSSSVEYEFRTTCTIRLTDQDIVEIAQMVKAGRKFVMQSCREYDDGKFSGRVERDIKTPFLKIHNTMGNQMQLICR